jgi:16S rRNA processing protein RimM
MEYTIVGKIINTHGIKGEVKVYPLTDEIERFSYLGKAYIGDLKEKTKIKTVRYHKGFPIIAFEGFDDINEILRFENQYFIYDLIDCEVFDMEKKKIGYIYDVLQNISNDVYVVKDDLNNKEYLIPAIKEFIRHVDIDNKVIMIDPIEGMIE